MTEITKDREPAAFSLDDPRLAIDTAEALPEGAPEPLPAEIGARGRSWWTIFLGAAGGLLVVSIFVWVQDTALTLLQRNDWLGWIAIALAVIAAVAFVVIVAREATALLRLSTLTTLHRRAEAAFHLGDAKEARAVSKALQSILGDRPELSLGLRRLKSHERDVLDAGQVFALTERELILPLDRLARAAIGSSGRRVAFMTTISPGAVLAVGFVAYENFRMLRSLAYIYGGRPGFFAILRLLRMIAAHLAVTGGIALTDDILQQFIGHGLTARLSRRLGEGLVNGGFTIRIGLAAVAVLRPLPYVEARKPRIREFVSEFLRFGQGQAGKEGGVSSSR